MDKWETYYNSETIPQVRGMLTWGNIEIKTRKS